MENHTHTRLLDDEEAGWYLNQSPRWIRSRWAAGELPGVKLGRSVRFRVEDLDRFIEAHTAGGQR